MNLSKEPMPAKVTKRNQEKLHFLWENNPADIFAKNPTFFSPAKWMETEDSGSK